jgi:phosphoribosylformylglycinamidine synthase PurS subunit
MRARVTVRLKAGVLDPQGLTIQKSLRSLGYDEVSAVRQGKVFDLELGTDAAGEARARLDEMCRRLLASPVVEDYQIEILG